MSKFLLVACAAVRALLRGSFVVSPECPGIECPAGPQGRIRRRSEPRMREAAEPAVPAVRSIALMVWRADMALVCNPLASTEAGLMPGWRNLLNPPLTLAATAML
jgi:hypothetical protein